MFIDFAVTFCDSKFATSLFSSRLDVTYCDFHSSHSSVHQQLNDTNRIIMLSWMMRHYKRDCPQSNQEIAAMLGISDLSLRVRTHRIVKKVNSSCTEIMRGGKLALDGEHLRMAEEINKCFCDLTPFLLKQYQISVFKSTGIIITL